MINGILTVRKLQKYVGKIVLWFRMQCQIAYLRNGRRGHRGPLLNQNLVMDASDIIVEASR